MANGIPLPINSELAPLPLNEDGIPIFHQPEQDLSPLPLNADGIPIFYEDEDECDMGEANRHVKCDEILHVGVHAHLAGRPQYQAYSNLNLHYLGGPPHPRTGVAPYVTSDLMVVRPFRRLPEDLASYTIGREGPAPVLVAEILSTRSAQQRDLGEKLVIYANMGVPEYVLIDLSGRYLPEHLVLKRLRRNRTWKDEHDADGGVTSRLGFRVVLEADGYPRLLDARTGKRYLRPFEAQAVEEQYLIEAKGREEAEERIRQLEAELARLRGASTGESQPTKKRTRRPKP